MGDCAKRMIGFDCEVHLCGVRGFGFLVRAGGAMKRLDSFLSSSGQKHSRTVIFDEINWDSIVVWYHIDIDDAVNLYRLGKR